MDTTQRQRAIWPRRHAITLMEILLVLAIMVLIAATTWPSLERSIADQRLKNAADTVRAEWSHARAKAMSSGTAYRFCYTPETRTYWIEPCEDDSNGAALADDNGPSSGIGSEPDQLQLPENITIVKGSVYSQSPEDVTSDETSTTQGAEPETWEDGEPDAPIVFAVDGTCSPARLTLQNEHERGITVTIRGLTAISVVGEVFNVEEEQP
ncbi:MAG: hypothetical protein JW888_09760 [Pirellulales bacterium]|nr:hypothetical protein [Pirellulales bacterium]